MSAATQGSRAWRFRHPDFAADQGLPGLVVQGGRVEMVSGLTAIRQSIFLLLSTRPGERVMRPDYGCRLHELVFAPLDDTTAGLAIHHVRQAIEAHEPRIEIVELDAVRHPHATDQLLIRLEYRARSLAVSDAIELRFHVADGGLS